MPKIIENVREQLLAEAKKQIAERGYANTTIRSVAGECGLAVGTVYNYFKSKEMLIASFMAEDWLECIKDIKNTPTDDPTAYLHSIYYALRSFEERYSTLFSDADAKKVFSSVFSQRHKQLRDQIAAFVLPLCQDAAEASPEFLSQFVAESLLTWTVTGVPFEELCPLLLKTIKNNKEGVSQHEQL
ncbi:MAG: TetR/AcrR family transcriptional regulator [Oscillospiraceae bacterium]|nr:TetR/AcrR family transcriptional regulator [Oscillospiraceae bacterium]MBQ9939053.1 TetR/AcrR family transcriptional regulator [Oscillospiraceae bacterium]